jgi:CheY-like chemotaxis protein
VLEAATGAAALEILNGKYAIDLLFSDLVMPGGINGRQLADEALRRRPGLKVLFMTGYTRSAIPQVGRRAADLAGTRGSIWSLQFRHQRRRRVLKFC